MGKLASRVLEGPGQYRVEWGSGGDLSKTLTSIVTAAGHRSAFALVKVKMEKVAGEGSGYVLSTQRVK